LKIVILHLSDLHFKESTKLFPAEKVAATLRQLPDHFLHIFIIISGDIAFSGNKLQYDLASIYLTALVAEIKKNTQVPVDVVAVPGNHDCQFPEDSSVRDLVISHLVREQDSFPSYEKLKQCVGVQDTFFEWLEKNTSNHLIKNDEKLCWTFSRILSSGKQVTFLCINSAWMSSLHESQGQLLFPSQSMPDEVSGDLIIAILHHPYNWFFSSNSREARTYLDNSADLVLTGHEHEAEAFSKTTLNGTNVSYVEGAVLGDPYNKSHSSFNILEIDLESPNCSFYNCDWNKQQYVLSTHTLNGPKIFSRRGRGKMSSYRVSNDMSTILKDPGLNLSHPRKQVEFEDIFIPQNLKTFVVRGKADNIQKELIYSDKIIETLFTEKFTNISGGEYSGKTSLAKFIFLESLNRGLIPILISGNKLKKTKPQHLQDVIIETFQMQYQQPGSQDFLQEPNEKKVLILDDFQEVNFNIKGRAVICEWLLDKFGYVFLMSKDRTQVEEAILDNETLKIWSKFKHYDIAPFGHHQRDRLIAIILKYP
jgi:predicted MPP superfamily phosphohydrolase